MSKNNIVLTGGHAATTAIAVIEEIKFQNKDWKIYWMGVKNAIEAVSETVSRGSRMHRTPSPCPLPIAFQGLSPIACSNSDYYGRNSVGLAGSKSDAGPVHSHPDALFCLKL